MSSWNVESRNVESLKIVSLKIVSWNVDGYTPDIHEWVKDYLNTYKPDILFLSETKKKKEDLEELFKEFAEYNFIINVHNPARWHGVSMLIHKRLSYEEIKVKLNIHARKDNNTKDPTCGRIIMIRLNSTSEFSDVHILGTYVPNSGGYSDQVKLDYRTKYWDPEFFKLLETYRLKGSLVWIGDINVAHKDIDVSHPKIMSKYAGFTLEERENFDKIINTNEYIDIWRRMHVEDRVWSWRGNSKGFGMRLDNIIITKDLLDKVEETFIIEGDQVPMSADHLPIGISIKLED